MTAIGIPKVQQALAEWTDTRVMTALDSTSPMRWILGGVSTIALARIDNLIKTYGPILKSLGVLDETGNLVLEVVTQFVNSAFQRQSVVRMPILGVPFNFNVDDGTALIECLKRYGG